MEKKDKKKIYISIVILSVIALVIIGTAYAYYRTVVKGNSEEKSLTVISKNLRVTYSDDNAVLTATNAHPGSSYEKTFYVTSVGKTSMDFGIKVENVENTFNRLQDWTYKLVRVLDDGEEVLKTGTLPNKSAYLLNSVTIEPNVTATYKLIIEYVYAYEDQSEDMGKSLSFKINLATSREVLEPENEDTLLYAIFNDNEVTNALTEPGMEINATNEAVLASSEDDYGTSYYFRGNVKNNYVTYANMCWRIVRVAGDESIKLILEDQDNECNDTNGNWWIPTTTGGSVTTGNFGYTKYVSGSLTASDGVTTNKKTLYIMDYLHGATESERSMATAFKNFQNTFTEDEILDLKAGNWCINDDSHLMSKSEMLDNRINLKEYRYSTSNRMSNSAGEYKPTLKCIGTIMNDWDNDEVSPTPMYVGALTREELAFAGLGYDDNMSNYLIVASVNFWTLTPYAFSPSSGYEDINIASMGSISTVAATISNVSFRPSIILNKDVTIVSGGNGTQSNPYVIS